MPTAGVEAVRAAYEAFQRGDLDAALAHVDPQVEISDPERAGAGPFRGREAYLAWLAEWVETWERYEYEIEALVDLVDQVVVIVRHRGRAGGSGIEIDQRGATVHAVRDGMIAGVRPYSRADEALEAAGLDDGPAWLAAIDTVLSGYAAWNRRDVDGIAALLEPGFEFIPLTQSPDNPPFGDREGLDRFVASSREAWEEFLFDPRAFTPAADRLMVELQVQARARHTGIELEERWAHVYTVREGRVVRMEAFRSRDEAVAALGEYRGGFAAT